MTDLLRQARLDEKEILKSIWKDVFDDESDHIDMFFDLFFSDSSSIVMECAGEVVGAAHIMPLGSLVMQDGQNLPCAAIYAVATLPKHRGKGYGTAITLATSDLCKKSGYEAITLCPAQKTLFNYYRSKMGFYSPFFISEQTFIWPKNAKPDAKWGIESVSPEDYVNVREKFLKDRVHIILSSRCAEYQLKLSSPNGGLFSLSYNGKVIGCAAVEPQPTGLICVKELLTYDNSKYLDDLVSLIASEVPGAIYSVRTFPDSKSLGRVRHFAMMLPIDGQTSYFPGAWYGLSYD